jgi:uncharacterized protein
MTAFLLDVNVLIALIDPMHIHHTSAHQWFEVKGKRAWASCPLTENAVLRIVGNGRYPNSPGTPAAVAEALESLVSSPGHVFWPDDITLIDSRMIDVSRLLNCRQVTDTYLLALAYSHGGQFATFDRRVVTDAVRGGRQALHLIS